MATKKDAIKTTTKTSKEIEALQFHIQGQPGKVAMHATKPLNTQRELALAYSPGVAVPCLEIQKNPELAYDYTSKGNYVAVISNGTAVLGLGNLGALAGKPVMEGKSVLFKRFADIDSVDIEVATENPDEFINAVKYLGPTWGGINLEDIKAPECFIIESKLREVMDIPVFHDDQHGTAIISAAGILNVLHLSGKKFKDVRVVVNGAGAAGIACLELLKAMGLPHENALLCDTKGVIYKGRTNGMNQWKSAHAVVTKARTLSDAMKGADVFLGLSVKGAVTKEMVKSMAKNPVIFAMANPDPEITPEEVHATRNDAIVATGRSDYENQVNNVMGFPYIFRGALDVRASTINEEMKIAAAKALAELAREHVPDEVVKAYGGREMKFGKHYIIPTPFDSRLIHTIPVAVAKAAVETGVARKPIKNWDAYVKQLKARRDPSANSMSLIFEKLKSVPKKVIFAEGEQPEIIRVAAMWRDYGYGKSILVGKKERVLENMRELDISPKGIEIYNAAISDENKKFTDYLYKKLQRNGVLYSDCSRMVKNDRNIFAASMLACGHGETLITGLTRGYRKSLTDVWQVIKNKKDQIVLGISMVISKGRTIFIADTACSELSSPEHLVKIALQTAKKVRDMGYEPRVAFLSFSNFGSALKTESERIKQAVKLMDELKVDFEYDGEMTADVAVNMDKMAKYPFCRLTAPANILICPGLHSANIATKLLEEVGSCAVIGPILDGFEKSVQIVTMRSSINDILNMTAIAAVAS
ncbi:MAG: malic enzyme [Alphaproteobacteria bacterium RIFCSPLOWO2_01_FULL_40_26]|nr:MAG: malic enzyme [Alphaproteobacteria bacterium RIFCSPHIGHO2_02_FULL_40_34]OFW88972.1 MAG: malic enzyme [Alphaproteobacteria bacterium RIFCSPHIGHO2_01_FULL_40_8]OFW95282.1 MAG: malic enzyme [Alphaproteobacteria bacterium RIFCSPLOWO2_01_FULL_40_26]OFX09185.1 MAG: malic enzyme [Alphaproteobacteria bacterium RIFCSPLOWO2_02_FULL_40_19]OFX11541.1 MAG: malic enzyme [Alphaproteobacteria bacterium RIFCSPLOWO2_12_FULL_40_11]